MDVEVDISNGLPSFTTVGLPAGTVREGRERVAAALGNSGFQLPLKRITVNLAPAEMPKRGSAFDLPIAVGILIASGQLDADPSGILMLGELGLEGDLRPIRGALSAALAARSLGCSEVVLPVQNIAEAAVVDGIAVRGAATLADVCAHLSGTGTIPAAAIDPSTLLTSAGSDAADFAEVKSQFAAKRALEVAAAGAHNILLIGSPGSGKTMLARRMPGILPSLTLTEALDVTRVHSVAGTIRPGAALIAERPFRAPHHTISYAGLIGGGSIPRPGEVSLAHHGVLFLDEIAELQAHTLEVLRQPLEDGVVTISRAAVTLSFPARFLFVAAMNPCPCGYAGDPRRDCHCAPQQVQKYLGRISGPLLDRVDIHLRVPPVAYGELVGEGRGESSAAIRERVERARAVQLERFRELPGMYANAHMGPREIVEFVPVRGESARVIADAVKRLGLSARAYHRVLKLARTLADLAGEREVEPGHIAEAVQYRVLDRG